MQQVDRDRAEDVVRGVPGPAHHDDGTPVTRPGGKVARRGQEHVGGRALAPLKGVLEVRRAAQIPPLSPSWPQLLKDVLHYGGRPVTSGPRTEPG
jgi:hypothetical protein